MERRNQRRLARRILVNFWIDGNPKQLSGYTLNLSLGGMFIASSTLPAKGARVKIEFDEGTGKRNIEATVIRLKMVPVELRRVSQAGFAVKLDQPMLGIVPDDDTTDQEGVVIHTVFKVEVASGAELLELFAREIKVGQMVLAPTSPVQAGEVVLVEIVPPADFGESVRWPAKVVQVGRVRITVTFEDLAELIGELAPLLEKARQSA